MEELNEIQDYNEESLDGYKYLFVDIDGTMLTSKKDVSKSTYHTFKQLNDLGVEVVLSSGRQRSNCEKIADIVGSGRYIISSNGGDVYDRATGNVVYSENMPIEALRKIIDIVNEYSLRIRIISGDTGFINKEILNPQDETLFDGDYEELFSTHNIPQVVLYMNTVEDFEKVKTLIANIPQVKIKNQTKNMENQKRFFIDVASKDTSKGKAIKFLLKELNIPTIVTMAIGDENNDVSMFDAVGVGIAMGNASKLCKERASMVTLDNDNDGIYKACVNLFDIEELNEEFDED